MECSHMLLYPGSCSQVEAGADLSAIWTSFATLAMSREMSTALADAPITITTYQCNAYFKLEIVKHINT